MARTPSKMIALGTPMPAFSLPEPLRGQQIFHSSSLRGRPSVVIFICNHCPYVQHIRAGLAAFGRDCLAQGVGMVAINSNDVIAYPADAPEAMASEAEQAGYVFPYLFDETQSVARAFDACCTPDLFIFTSDGSLAYRGQFDEARPSNAIPVTGNHARAAVQALLAGTAPSSEQIPSIGCGIKWKPM
jgi:peroxiredoxin